MRIAPGAPLAASTRGATRELREPGHSSNVPHTIWFKLSVATPTNVRLAACNGSYPDLTVYTGSSVRGLTRVGQDGSCMVDFTALPGITYRFVAEDSGGGGAFRLTAAATAP